MEQLDETPLRLRIMLIALAAGCMFVLVASLVLDAESLLGAFLLDVGTEHLPYPLTVQNVMWLIFFITAGEIYVRYRRADREAAQLRLALLPEDDQTMLVQSDLGAINAAVKPGKGYFLQRLITRCILQFQSSKSIDQANSLLNSSLELMQHEVDTRYNIVRYLVWLIPTLGFIGTVVGIAFALGDAAGADDFQDKTVLQGLIKSLGVAFYTTLLALIHSTFLVFALHIAQAKEELALNRAGQYCLDNLINKLYER